MEQISQMLKDINRCGRQYREERLEPLGLAQHQGLYLRVIGQNPGISQERLAQKLSVNKSNVARQAAMLEEEGFILRSACGKDKRVLQLELTEKGAALLPQIHAVIDSWEQMLVHSLTASEQQILEILLQKLRSNASRGLKEVQDEGSV